MESSANWLLYDGECPFCSRYVVHVRLRAAIGPVMLANAREHPALVEEVRRLGYDVDEGMVLKLDWNGKVLGWFGKAGTEPLDISEAHYMTMSADLKTVYVADSAGGKLHKFVLE